jgi:hypothetical protein
VVHRGSRSGAGPRKTVVAYSAICAHQLAYPAREVSFIRFQESPSKTSPGSAIHWTIGAEQFDAFFRKYEYKLGMDYGDPGRARRGRSDDGMPRDVAGLPADDPVLIASP